MACTLFAPEITLRSISPQLDMIVVSEAYRVIRKELSTIKIDTLSLEAQRNVTNKQVEFERKVDELVQQNNPEALMDLLDEIRTYKKSLINR